MNEILPQGGSVYWWFYSPVIAEVLTVARDQNTHSSSLGTAPHLLSPACWLSALSASLKETPFSRHINDQVGLSFTVKSGWKISAWLKFPSVSRADCAVSSTGTLAWGSDLTTWSTDSITPSILAERHCWDVQSCRLDFGFPPKPGVCLVSVWSVFGSGRALLGRRVSKAFLCWWNGDCVCAAPARDSPSIWPFELGDGLEQHPPLCRSCQRLQETGGLCFRDLSYTALS